MFLFSYNITWLDYSVSATPDGANQFTRGQSAERLSKIVSPTLSNSATRQHRLLPVPAVPFQPPTLLLATQYTLPS